MIIDLAGFIGNNRGHWKQLEDLLDSVETRPEPLSMDEAMRLHYLYERSAADLARIQSLSADAETTRYLEALVGRAYAMIYETRGRRLNFSLRRWFFHTFPATFRRHSRAFALSVALTIAGSALGAVALVIDVGAKRVLMPFPHLRGNPADRVKAEESREAGKGQAGRSQFSAELMTHNTRVAIFTAGLGVTAGIGSSILLFYNGVILGAVALDYVRAGYVVFLLGWLLPHGVIEIPAILIGGQAGFVIAGALIGAGSKRRRLREVRPAVLTLIGGVAIMLVWAGIVESFLSQFHAPVFPYSAKIAFGVVELALLTLWLSRSGRSA